jgi:hypothetical protein
MPSFYALKKGKIEHVVPNTWLVYTCTNLSRQEALVLKDARFQLQQRKALSPRYRLSTIVTLRILWTDLCAQLNLEAHPTSNFRKIVCHNLVAPTTNHKNKWKNAGSWSIRLLVVNKKM